MTPWIHLVARTLWAKPIFSQRDTAVYAWSRLRASFPRALAAVLMPEHLHVVVPKTKGVVWELGVVIRSISRHLKSPPLWEDIPEARGIADRQHLLRTVRYLHLNPCRRGIVDDPLMWEWSTHRDVLGLVADPWVGTKGLSTELDWPGAQFQKSFHEYVCREDCVSKSALRLPPPAVEVADLGSLADMERAYAVYRRVSLSECRQRGEERSRLVRLALLCGQASEEAIQRHFQVSDDTLLRHRASGMGTELKALQRGLGRLVADPRLTCGFTRANAALGPHSRS